MKTKKGALPMKTIIALIARMLLLILCTVIIILMLI